MNITNIKKTSVSHINDAIQANERASERKRIVLHFIKIVVFLFEQNYKAITVKLNFFASSVRSNFLS